MTELKTTPSDHRTESWLPNFDLHEQDGELVLHADLQGRDEDMEVSLDGGDLIVHAAGGSQEGSFACYARLPLPFAPQTLCTVSQSGRGGLEIHIPIPEL